MIFHPLILSLNGASILISLMILFSSYFSFQILRKWDLASGSELQLSLERKTYLISTLLAYLFGAQLLSLFLYVFTVDHLHVFFVGAMCAAGSLNVNGYGYPALVLKVGNFLLAGLWLILNYADNRGYDYPLVKKKYWLLLLISPFILMEAFLQINYFLRLKPDIITSCCGSLFSTEGTAITSEIASLPSIPMKVAFYLAVGLTVTSGTRYSFKGKGEYLFAGLSIITFFVSVLSLVSFISIYFYELPTHHCPFCILQKEYGYVGYPLYLTLLGGAIAGMGVGVLAPFREIKSLKEVLPSIQKKLALTSSILFLIFSAIVTYRMIFTDFMLEGY